MRLGKVGDISIFMFLLWIHSCLEKYLHTLNTHFDTDGEERVVVS
jgi:hypothetical protein